MTTQDPAGLLRERAQAVSDWFGDGPQPGVVLDLRAALAATGDSGGPPVGTKLVLMSDEVFAALGADRVDWGEPNANGWYSPTVYHGPKEPVPYDKPDHAAREGVPEGDLG